MGKWKRINLKCFPLKKYKIFQNNYFETFSNNCNLCLGLTINQASCNKVNNLIRINLLNVIHEVNKLNLIKSVEFN